MYFLQNMYIFLKYFKSFKNDDKKICIKSFKKYRNIYKRVGPSLEKNENVFKKYFRKNIKIYIESLKKYKHIN